VSSQTISIKPQRVKTVVNSVGDTLIEMSLADAKIILADIIDKQVADSMLLVYEFKDSISKSTIQVQLKQINILKEKVVNCETIIANLNEMLANKDKEIDLLNETIKKQKREIRKQKILKIIGFTSAVVLPVITLVVLLGVN
jgi:hypothetical protein